MSYSSISELSDNDEQTIYEDLEWIAIQIKDDSNFIKKIALKSNKLSKSNSEQMLTQRSTFVDKELDNGMYQNQTEKSSQCEQDDSRIENSNFAINLAKGK